MRNSSQCRLGMDVGMEEWVSVDREGGGNRNLGKSKC